MQKVWGDARRATEGAEMPGNVGMTTQRRILLTNFSTNYPHGLGFGERSAEAEGTQCGICNLAIRAPL